MGRESSFEIGFEVAEWTARRQRRMRYGLVEPAKRSLMRTICNSLNCDKFETVEEGSKEGFSIKISKQH